MQWQRVKVLFFSPERDFAAWLQRHKATLYTNDEFGQQIISEIAQAQKLSKEMEAFCIQIYKESKVMVLWDPPLEYEFNCVSSDSGSTVELVLPAIVESRTRNLFFPQLVLRSEEVHHGSTTVQQHVQAVPSSAGYQPPQKIPPVSQGDTLSATSSSCFLVGQELFGSFGLHLLKHGSVATSASGTQDNANPLEPDSIPAANLW
ncbi:hypothetical protein Pelo_9138 [Pelomyxa schiedti]|nr:hypothetical protein Pelo_9138 [Pelomyxa schiedti]